MAPGARQGATRRRQGTGGEIASAKYRTIVADPPCGEHSAKPDAFYDLVESVSPGPYLELFARRQRLGWDTWGEEALEHISISAGGA